jgi:hypothetical protein
MSGQHETTPAVHRWCGAQWMPVRAITATHTGLTLCLMCSGRGMMAVLVETTGGRVPHLRACDRCDGSGWRGNL